MMSEKDILIFIAIYIVLYPIVMAIIKHLDD